MRIRDAGREIAQAAFQHPVRVSPHADVINIDKRGLRHARVVGMLRGRKVLLIL